MLQLTAGMFAKEHVRLLRPCYTYIGENLIKLQNSILCSFYDDHLLDEPGFEHTQLCFYKQTPFG